MNNLKNLIIALLTGLLALSLFTQPAQSAPKTYDAVKLAQYSACLERTASSLGGIFNARVLDECKSFKP